MQIKKKIAIIGLGYVGLPLALAFSKKFKVLGYDISKTRVINLQNGFDKNNEFKKNSLLKNKKMQIKFLGKKNNDQLPYYYNKSRAYVICSKVEGNPKSLLEAMACKCPIVGTNVEGIKDLIVNKKNGLLSSQNTKSLKNSILKILNNKKLSENLSINALNYVKKNNSISNFLKYEIKTILKYAN